MTGWAGEWQAQGQSQLGMRRHRRLVPVQAYEAAEVGQDVLPRGGGVSVFLWRGQSLPAAM